MHYRQQIRQQIQAQLNGLATTGSSVYLNRRFAINAERLPALFIYVLREDKTEIETGANGHSQRNLSIVVEAWAVGSTVENDLDDIAEEAENAIYADRTLNGLALDCNLIRSEFIHKEENEQDYLVLRLLFDIQYYTTNNSATI